MRIWRVFVAVPLFALSSQGAAENWVYVDAQKSVSVDWDSVRVGADDLLLHFTDRLRINGTVFVSEIAVDCEDRVSYTVSFNGGEVPNWHDKGAAFGSNSLQDSELKYVCAKF